VDNFVNQSHIHVSGNGNTASNNLFLNELASTDISSIMGDGNDIEGNTIANDHQFSVTGTANIVTENELNGLQLRQMWQDYSGGVGNIVHDNHGVGIRMIGDSYVEVEGNTGMTTEDSSSASMQIVASSNSTLRNNTNIYENFNDVQGSVIADNAVKYMSDVHVHASQVSSNTADYAINADYLVGSLVVDNAAIDRSITVGGTNQTIIRNEAGEMSVAAGTFNDTLINNDIDHGLVVDGDTNQVTLSGNTLYRAELRNASGTVMMNVNRPAETVRVTNVEGSTISEPPGPPPPTPPTASPPPSPTPTPPSPTPPMPPMPPPPKPPAAPVRPVIPAATPTSVPRVVAATVTVTGSTLSAAALDSAKFATAVGAFAGVPAASVTVKATRDVAAAGRRLLTATGTVAVDFEVATTSAAAAIVVSGALVNPNAGAALTTELVAAGVPVTAAAVDVDSVGATMPLSVTAASAASGAASGALAAVIAAVAAALVL
jgi:hypothetical protein